MDVGIDPIKYPEEVLGYDMRCFSPISIKDPSQADPKVRLEVPCGRCLGCKTNRRIEWSVRLEEELRVSQTAYFITLTYASEPLTPHLQPTLLKKDVQNLLKRMRKQLKGQQIKYYLVGEYGEKTYRPHYHMLLFNLPMSQLEAHAFLLQQWNQGIVHLGAVTPKSIKYTLKYMLKSVQEYNGDGERQRPFALMSKGIGKSYLQSKKVDWHKKDVSRNYVVNQGGYKLRLPRYYREKIYSESDRKVQNEIYQQAEIDKWQQLDDQQQAEFLKNQYDVYKALENRAEKIINHKKTI